MSSSFFSVKVFFHPLVVSRARAIPCFLLVRGELAAVREFRSGVYGVGDVPQ